MGEFFIFFCKVTYANSPNVCGSWWVSVNLQFIVSIFFYLGGNFELEPPPLCLSSSSTLSWKGNVNYSNGNLKLMFSCFNMHRYVYDNRLSS